MLTIFWKVQVSKYTSITPGIPRVRLTVSMTVNEQRSFVHHRIIALTTGSALAKIPIKPLDHIFSFLPVNIFPMAFLIPVFKTLLKITKTKRQSLQFLSKSLVLLSF